MALWTDLITPAELTGYARAAQDDIERAQGTLARFLPNTTVPDVVVRTIVASDGSGQLAQYRAFDAETPLGYGGTAQRKTFELLPLGLKERVSEYELLRGRSGVQEQLILGGVLKATRRVVEAIVKRLEVARGQVIDTGSLTINENKVVQTVSFGRPGGNTVTASVLWDAGSGTPKPIDDLIAWCDYYASVNDGAQPGALLVSRKVVAVLQRVAEIRTLVATMAGTPTIVSIDALNSVLSGSGLPPLVVFDRKVNGTRVTNEKKVYLLPEVVDPNSGENNLGATFVGPTLEADDPRYGIGAADQPGVAVGAWKTDDPIAAWVRSNAVAMPILVNPVASMVATVLT